MANTADRLLDGLKRRGIVPSSQPLYSDSDFLAAADDVIQERMIPLMLSIRQDYFVTSTNKPTVANQAEYDIPYRSIGRTLRDLKLEDDSGTVRDLTLIALEDEHLFQNSATSHSFYFKGDKYVIVPPPTSATLTLVEWWECPPSKLVKTDSASVVVSKTSTTVTVTAVPSAITTGAVVDFVQGKSGNSLLAYDKTIANVAGTTITFTSGDIPDSLVAGDYISLAMTAPVVMLPNEAYPLLETFTAQRILNSIGDFEGAQALEESVTAGEKNLKMILEPRIKGENTIIINRRGLLRSARLPYRRGIIY
jgi:hypothetical protein